MPGEIDVFDRFGEISEQCRCRFLWATTQKQPEKIKNTKTG
jgi:hypothetical protein